MARALPIRAAGRAILPTAGRAHANAVPWNAAALLTAFAGMIKVKEPNSMRYTVVLERENDGGYVAIVPALPGCVSQGDTHDEVLRNIREAADLYIEDCIAAGDPVPSEAGREYFEIKTGTR